nr:immunoglobulin heavy chain junction region [Mus musculus]
CVRLRRMDFW